MKLKNHAMKNASLSLRYTRDEDGKPIVVAGDADGVFDLSSANAKDAEFLQKCAGWAVVAEPPKKKAKHPAPLPKAPPPPAEPVSVVSDTDEIDTDEIKAVTPDADTLPAPPSPEADPQKWKEEIAMLSSKRSALKLAERLRSYGCEVPELDTGKRLSELRMQLLAAVEEAL